jgi:acyl carrier protein
MIPAHFIFLEAIPFYDGKVDRTALPKPDGKRPPLEQVYVSPQREIERTLIGIWEQVLNVRPIGVCDNFFDLGGHSLAATRVISELARQLRLEIPLKAMLDFPTVAAMATFVEMCPANKIIDARELGDILSELESISDERAGRLLNIIESWERTKST